ncbi:MAG: cytochrome c biogenesis protein CcdA [Eubacteriales bacterium]|nr:cytochrome c biogenesis protein CcdA [Eubacteriales bacterium]MDD4139694.1 cytochrome c biogenesis protein CcdA [Eubacteriales bacterium]NLO34975.1 cytochrome c biogenesis protein CcdA [Clostridiaceae bacterium]
MINDLLEQLSTAIANNLWLAPLLALLGGLLTAFTPCSLSSVPLVIGAVGGYAANDTRKAFSISLVFCAGMAVTFTALGLAASLLGRLMQGAGSWWYLILGVLMILMALQTWEVITIIPQSALASKNTRRGYLGAGLAGLLGGLFASPCATPVLVALLALVAREGKLLMGFVLLLLYSLGHSVLLLIAGTSVGFVKQLSRSPRYGKASQALKIAMGSVILILGFFLLYQGF